ncbi:glycosyltransferase family 4 protein [Rhodocyclus purpureus]|uniref:glycosyltransferase family 4 protein n=1 Tax=Rhodocyclus purpureus TaxID=1067 RepID=UPI0019127F8E|nr:glycosyltransferase family 1 protein [Rhodocyclus purpureus]MBK5913172.1 hypothetical protein [Rhodocyclus purpureus]
MLILVDTKNLALYGGGISHWFAPLLAAWIVDRPDARFLLVGPSFDTAFLPECSNWEHVSLTWPEWLPRSFRHPWYDNVLFPRVVRRLRPDFVMSPYHDVRIPKGVPSVISVHDLCLDELESVYPRRIRAYYLTLLRRNLRQAAFVLTVSETSRSKLIERYGVPPDRVGVVYNAPPAAFDGDHGAEGTIDFRARFGLHGRLLFYPGGAEYRKNMMRLVQVFAKLAQSYDDLFLLVTGENNARWSAAIAGLPNVLSQRIVFTGRLDDADLRLAYSAVDAVIYPSLCEGFGRVCLEAMDTGTPLACSDLPVMREVAGDYAHYFDPYCVDSMCQATAAALSQGRRHPVKEMRFQTVAVRDAFLCAMDRFTEAKP